MRPRLYPSRSPMAVPKQKQSHSRTSKRRAQHKISAPTYNACPTCHSPRLPHRVCPTCGSYARPRGRARARPRSRPRALGHPGSRGSLHACPSRSRSTPTAPTSGPPKSPRARRRSRSRGCASCSSARRAVRRRAPTGVEVVDAPVSIAKAPDPVRAAASNPDASIVQAARAVAAGDADALRQRRLDRRRAGRRPVQHQARRGHPPPGAGDPGPGPRAPGHARRRRRQHRGPRRAPRPVRASWARRWPRPCSASSARASALLSIGEEATKGTPLVIEAHAALRDAPGRGRHASTSSATSRATRSRPARPTSSSPTASPATSR